LLDDDNVQVKVSSPPEAGKVSLISWTTPKLLNLHIVQLVDVSPDIEDNKVLAPDGL
jgi:hypothetical protein